LNDWTSDLIDRNPNSFKTLSSGVRVPRQHGLDSVADDLSQIGVVNASSAKVSDVGVAALVGADV
jgi:hypothetical protein